MTRIQSNYLSAVCLLFMVGAALLAQEAAASKPEPPLCLYKDGKLAPKQPPECTPQFPEITDAQRADYWMALSDLQAAQKQLDAATAALQAKVADMQKACGDRQLIQDAKRQPACQPKPPEPAKEPAK